MKRYLVVAIVLACGLVALATAPTRGSVHATSATSAVTRVFTTGVAYLTVAPLTQNVVVLLTPSEAQDDSITVNAGSVFTWGNGTKPIYGFAVLRSVATAVDIFWQ